MGQHSWEFTSLVQTWTQKTWDLLDQRLGSEESIVLLGELLDQFLVLVELLEVISAHVWDTLGLGLVVVGGITDNADLLLWAGDVWQLDGTAETLVLLGVVVLEGDLELDGLQEVTLLLVGALEDLAN